MRFWDSSALVPLIVGETATPWARRLLRSDPAAIVWTLSQVEVRSALSRRLREKALTRRIFDDARRRSERLFAAVSHVVALEQVSQRAIRLLDLHDLRAADALQLATALVASAERPQTIPFVTLDQRLALAARSEGFPVETTA
jgi:predicted nucleic acid-binding protein